MNADRTTSLILGRRIGQEIVIGNDIIVRVVGIRGNLVRLGILAPASVRVDRREYRDFLDGQVEGKDRGERADGNPDPDA